MPKRDSSSAALASPRDLRLGSWSHQMSTSRQRPSSAAATSSPRHGLRLPGHYSAPRLPSMTHPLLRMNLTIKRIWRTIRPPWDTRKKCLFPVRFTSWLTFSTMHWRRILSSMLRSSRSSTGESVGEQSKIVHCGGAQPFGKSPCHHFQYFSSTCPTCCVWRYLEHF